MVSPLWGERKGRALPLCGERVEGGREGGRDIERERRQVGEGHRGGSRAGERLDSGGCERGEEP